MDTTAEFNRPHQYLELFFVL